MGFLDTIQKKTGFTRREAVAVLTLSATFLIGLGIRSMQSTHEHQVQPLNQFDYTKSDSIYKARGKLIGPESASGRQRVTTPYSGTSLSKIARTADTTQTVNINTANRSELMTLNGIGPAFADRIIEYRKEHGIFKSVHELTNIKGIGPKRFERLRSFVRLK